MNITLYKNSSPPNQVEKTLTNENEIEAVRFIEKGTLDILNPSVLIQLTADIKDASKYNYMYIPKFSRYYFIDSISTEGGLIRINGRVDSLMSHKTDILSSKQYILRQESKNNSPYLEDNMLPISSNHNYVGKVFGRKVADTTCGRVILATTGKGGTIV